MTWYLLLAIILIMQLRTLIQLNLIHRDDEVKSRFCELHDRMTDFLCSDESMGISTSDYKQVNRLLHLNRVAIHKFEHFKFSLNFRRFLKYAREVNSRIMKEETKMEMTDNRVIQSFYSSFAYSVVNGFFAYTPFLRHEIILRLLKAAAKLLAAVGNERLSRLTKEMQQIVVNLSRRDDPSLCLN